MPDVKRATFTAFEYRYRDASNYKVSSRILLSGTLTESDRAEITGKLQDGEYFIAEQVGIPSLRQALYELSDGPTDDDHAWHEFDAIVDEPSPGDEILWGSAAELLLNFQNVENWNLERSEFTS
jgi:hypothetical protein